MEDPMIFKWDSPLLERLSHVSHAEKFMETNKTYNSLNITLQIVSQKWINNLLLGFSKIFINNHASKFHFQTLHMSFENGAIWSSRHFSCYKGGELS